MILLLNAIPVIVPLQMVCELGVAVTVGRGFTVISTVIESPEQVYP